MKTDDTYTAQTEWFLRFQKEGRPLDVTVGPDGGLYVADYEMNLVYRIVYGAP
jgi:glucose/arabinose dehydrogenase